MLHSTWWIFWRDRIEGVLSLDTQLYTLYVFCVWDLTKSWTIVTYILDVEKDVQLTKCRALYFLLEGESLLITYLLIPHRWSFQFVIVLHYEWKFFCGPIKQVRYVNLSITSWKYISILQEHKHIKCGKYQTSIWLIFCSIQCCNRSTTVARTIVALKISMATFF